MLKIQKKKIIPRRKEAVVSLVSLCCPCVTVEFLGIGFLSSFHDCWLLDLSKNINGEKNVILCNI